MGLGKTPRLLLLDLDCVTLYGGNPRDGLPPEVYLLHPDLPDTLAQFGAPVVLLTHRSREDADYLNRCLQAHGVVVQGIVSARELFLSALRQGKIRLLVNKGLSKSLALDWLERRYDCKRTDMVLIDDRAENLQELCDNGMQAGILAPFVAPDSFDQQAELTTFQFADVVAQWHAPQAWPTPIFTPPTCTRTLAELPLIGSLSSAKLSYFEQGRQLIKSLRRWQQRLFRSSVQ
ncbi:MAG TPA: hypothetical protein DD979_10975 [Gammaproteobacteria bacterium]|nr:hypothetical protein [Gammaproteobacteria bacterium]